MNETKFVLCFLHRQDQLLMLKRAKAPNQGLWNCVGGHIEGGETALAACIREVYEETGYTITNLVFHGLLTWQGFEIPAGGLYLFSAPAPQEAEPRGNGEGMLEWKSVDWVIHSDEVVDNLHIVTPHILRSASPALYHFDYKDGQMKAHQVLPLPSWISTDQPFIPA